MLNVKIWGFVAPITTIIFISFLLLYAQLPFFVDAKGFQSKTILSIKNKNFASHCLYKTRLKSFSVSKAAKLMQTRLPKLSRGWICDFGSQKIIFDLASRQPKKIAIQSKSRVQKVKKKIILISFCNR